MKKLKAVLYSRVTWTVFTAVLVWLGPIALALRTALHLLLVEVMYRGRPVMCRRHVVALLRPEDVTDPDWKTMERKFLRLTNAELVSRLEGADYIPHDEARRNFLSAQAELRQVASEIALPTRPVLLPDPGTKYLDRTGKVQFATNAAAMTLGDRAFVLASPGILGMNQAERRAIWAHELAHVRYRDNDLRWGRLARAEVLLKFGVQVTASLVLPVALAIAVSLLFVFALYLGNLTLRRRNEYRADRLAHSLPDTDSESALGKLSENGLTVLGPKRPLDLPWHLEDLLRTHGSLANRIAAVKRSPAVTARE